MKKYLLLFFSVLFICSCSDEIPNEDLPLKSGRTVLAYLVSNNSPNNSLDRYLKKNLVDMYSGLASVKDTCTLLVYYRPYEDDKDGIVGPSILKFTTNGNGYINKKPALTGRELNIKNVIGHSIITSYDEKEHNAVSPKTMKRVLEKMKELSPSDSYGLVFGSHGSGWMPGEKNGRSFGDDNGYSIDIPQMADVLDDVFDNPLEFILFDACMMCTAEVCYELKDVTNYLIGSVVETHTNGFPYDIVMPKLFDKKVRYDEICRDYIGYSDRIKSWGMCAAIDCSKMEELAGWMKDNIGQYSEALQNLDLDMVQQYGIDNYKYFSFDVEDLLKVLGNGVLPVELDVIMDRVVIAKAALYGSSYKVVGKLPIKEGHYCGLGMYIPFNKDIDRQDWDEYYEESVAWYKDAGWENLFDNEN